MNITIKHKSIKIFLRVVVIVIIVKLLWIASSFFLPKNGVDNVTFEAKNFYDKYRVSKAFGLQKVVTHTTASSSESLPLYKLDNMKLQGIYSSKDQSFVMLQDGSNVEMVSKNESYKGYLLADVLPKKAIFVKDGARYELALEEEAPLNQAQGADIMGDDVVRFVSKPQIQKYAKDVNAIWKNITIQEIVDKGTLKGFKVTKIDKTSIFGKLGLEVDDIIVGANNKRFVSYSDVINLYKDINNMDSLKITFIRNNQEKELEYEIY